MTHFTNHASRLTLHALFVAAVVGFTACTDHPGRTEHATEPPTIHTVWVLLDDASSGDALAATALAVSPAALATRPALDTDRPVDPRAVAAIAATGATVRYASRWLRAVSVDADATTLHRISRLPAVTGILPVRDAYPAGAAAAPSSLSTLPRSTAVPRSAAAAAVQDSSFYGATYAALRELNIPILHELGFTGDASRIAILDTGFSLVHESLRTREIADQWDFINGDDYVGNQPAEAEPMNQERHGTFVFSLLGGYAPGQLVGGAYDAAFYLAKVSLADFDVRADEDRWVAAVEWADSVGARIINSSIGFRNAFIDRSPIMYGELDGSTTITTRMADEAARRGILLINSMGNAGPSSGSLWAPADADSIIAVGAVDSLTAGGAAVPTSSSSRGPTADGRIKPDVVARGHNLIAASTSSPTNYEGGLTGSSFATPFITAGVALFMEAWPSLSIMAVRDAIRLAGSNADRPNNVVGWGVPDIAAAVMFPLGIQFDANSLTPTDQQGSVTSIAPTFRWNTPLIHPLMRPITYRIDIARDSLFTNIIVSDTVTDASSYVVRVPLQPITNAWWRIVATSPQGVRREAMARPSFTVPPWVRLLTLAEPEPEFVRELRPELSWAPLSAPEPFGRFTYRVQILSPAGAVLQDIRDVETTSVEVPHALTPNQSYRWRVIATTQGGVADTVESAVPFVVISDEAPPVTVLYSTFPNPFPVSFGAAHVTNVWFDLAEPSTVELAVYDIRGRLVRSLIPARPDCPNAVMRAGLYGRPGGTAGANVPADCALFAWDATDVYGERVPRGVYVIRLRAAGVEDVRRILYLPPQ